MTWTHTYWDYWGTQVTAFDVLVPHEDARGRRDAAPSRPVAGRASVVADADVGRRCARDVGDRPVDEFLGQTRSTDAGRRGRRHGPRRSRRASDPDAAARAICERIAGLVEYVPGVTGVHTDAAEVWRQNRQGVCQDFAHLTLGALRSLGIPARYVSGYLHPRPDARARRDASRARATPGWSGGRGSGSPSTRPMPARSSADHVVVARGRDYADVPPLKGVYAGTAASQLFVSVAADPARLTRLR